MTRKLFGTDGIRGEANRPPMDVDTIMRCGMAAGSMFKNGHRPRVVIGKDTRLSGYMVEQALTAGFLSVGMDVLLFGPLPTPAVAMLTRSLRADLGVMISASHNPFHDNGIKLFGPDGYKLSDEQEKEIERLMRADPASLAVAPDKLGRAKRIEDAQARYIEFAKRTLPRGQRFDGLRVVIDCANGAAYKVAPDVLWELGAEVVKIGIEPDGFNINDGLGTTAPQTLQAKVREMRADVGIALDGDADRVMIVDEKGRVIDGDQIIALIATAYAERQLLSGGGVVATVMSNLGLERYLDDLGLELVRTQVGDRYVMERMRAGGYNVGGEQSGHVILSDFVSTGDGLVTALQVLAVVANSGRKVSEVCHLFTPVPQVLENVRINGADPLKDTRVQQVIAEAERRLADTGRLLIRRSGTEPLIRVMAEGDDEQLVRAVVAEIVAAMQPVGVG
ncbi:MAG TPA: phosphoglucosamine mutase [Thermopetrobacter sp.]|nr:phosphoglucosamine mutase [Thermopetrobacter sp.]